MKKFTLAELITVIVVISILASIVLINISNLREKANVSAIQSNIHSLQKAVNIYMNKNNSELPSKEGVSLGNPSSINYEVLYSDYIKNVPELKKAHYWVDYQGYVWGSTIDVPSNIVITEQEISQAWTILQKAHADERNKVVTWEYVKDAAYYNVYTLNPEKRNQLVLLGETKDPNYKFEKNIKEGEVFISAVDSYELETPPVSILRETVEVEDEIIEEEVVEVNEPPTVGLHLRNASEFSYTEVPDLYVTYNDPEGETNPAEEEFYLNDIATTLENINKLKPVGSYTVKYRAKDSAGNWSDFANYNFRVVDKPPIVTLKLNETVKITDATRLSFTKTFEDPEGQTRRVSEEYLVNGTRKNNIDGYYRNGTHTISYRAKDSNGIWSDYVTVVIKVEKLSTSNFKWQYVMGEVTFEMNALQLVKAGNCQCTNATGPNLRLVSKIGKVNVDITGAGYGTYNVFPHTSSIYAGDMSEYRYKTINATIDEKGGFIVSFAYTDTFVHLTEIKASSSITYIN